jgi:hypothetical protein
MLAKGDFVLSAAMLERIYLAMEQAAPPPQTEDRTMAKKLASRGRDAHDKSGNA